MYINKKKSEMKEKETAVLQYYATFSRIPLESEVMPISTELPFDATLIYWVEPF